MLSRTADHLFWMARYMERAENTARMLDVNYQMSLLPQSDGAAERGWRGLLEHQRAQRRLRQAPRRGDAAERHRLHGQRREERLVDPLLPDGGARERARRARHADDRGLGDAEPDLARVPAHGRDQRLPERAPARRSSGSSSARTCRAASPSARCCRTRPSTSCASAASSSAPTTRRACSTSSSTRSRTTSSASARARRRRACATASARARARARAAAAARAKARARAAAAARAQSQSQEQGGKDVEFDFYHWSAVLRSVSGFEVYRKVYRNVIRPEQVAELLILRPDMPRSLAACMHEVVSTCSASPTSSRRTRCAWPAGSTPTCSTAASTRSSRPACMPT